MTRAAIRDRDARAGRAGAARNRSATMFGRDCAAARVPRSGFGPYTRHASDRSAIGRAEPGLRGEGTEPKQPCRRQQRQRL
ncbi:hypothetical protein D8O27_23610 [Burkholderia mallei]|uniref:Uncharacterized protein n=1 Tax=Burkholderia mallei TaxID=13373 RepID=A0AAX1XFJ8_BURML|nr:hypothetical protein DM57_06305 [Burkholderia mallei]ALB11721.1 hypothetical protein ACT79_06245 [Burkholderia pseudomallei]AOP70088.1 hypothetical protein BHL98_08305 [Burkholderia mallei]APY97363.1 hypothetical protein BGI50_24080 [Burkholderia pseudomallei]ATD92117.1 hypothetical protein NM78_16620 [Burkholderia mallei]